MRRRTVWVAVGVVIVVVVGAALIFAWAGHDAPDIPHGAGDDRAACTSCHSQDRLPGSHADRDDGECRSCHDKRDAAMSPAGGAAGAELALE